MCQIIQHARPQGFEGCLVMPVHRVLVSDEMAGMQLYSELLKRAAPPPPPAHPQTLGPW